MGAVGKSAAADHQIFQVGEIRLTHMLIALAHLPHGDAGQRQSAVDQVFQHGGHPIAVKRKAEQQQITCQNLLQNGAHIVLVTAHAAVAHTGKAPGAECNVPVDDMDQLNLLGRRILHSIQEGTGDMQCIAAVSLRASVKNQNFHFSCSFPERWIWCWHYHLVSKCELPVPPKPRLPQQHILPSSIPQRIAS